MGNRVCDNIPIVLVANKIDVKDRKVRNVTFHRKRNLAYYEVSAKSNYNFEKPFLCLARIIVGDKELQFVEAPALDPPDIHLTDQQKAQMDRDAAIAASVPVPDDDDDDDL